MSRRIAWVLSASRRSVSHQHTSNKGGTSPPSDPAGIDTQEGRGACIPTSRAAGNGSLQLYALGDVSSETASKCWQRELSSPTVRHSIDSCVQKNTFTDVSGGPANFWMKSCTGAWYSSSSTKVFVMGTWYKGPPLVYEVLNASAKPLHRYPSSSPSQRKTRRRS